MLQGFRTTTPQLRSTIEAIRMVLRITSQSSMGQKAILLEQLGRSNLKGIEVGLIDAEQAMVEL
jgi:hypothetical protein